MNQQFPCTFCGEKLPTKSARKKHNISCKENKNRERNQRIAREANAKIKKYQSKSIRREVFECMADDLPDGAYFAMAEEFGLQPEDLI